MGRSAEIPSLENIKLWHERDSSHSGVERNMGPDTKTTLDFALVRLNGGIKNLKIDPKNMVKNLNLTNGLFFSQRVLIELTSTGFTREQAYALVQKHAMQSWNSGTSFYENIVNDPKINKKLPVNKIKKLFNFSYHTKRIDIIFRRSLNK